MAGTSQPAGKLACRGFVETDGFGRSKADLRTLYGLTDRQVDDRLEALLWALARGGDPALAQRIPTRRNLWVAVTPRGIPPLRIYLRPRADVPEECELLWVEERL
jgi:hypothetical protein